jgi:signal transduction histidine kinase
MTDWAALPRAMGQRLAALRPVGERLLEGPWSLRGALISIILLAAIPSLVFSGILLERYAASERLRATVQLEESAKSIARAIDAEFASAEAVLSALAVSVPLADNDLPAFEHQLRAVAASTGRTFELVDLNGRALISTLSNPPSLTGRPAPKSRQTVITDVLPGPAGEPTARVIVPILRDGAPHWTLQNMLRGEQFRHILMEPGVPPDWIFSIVDRNGMRIIRSHLNDTYAGKSLSPPLMELVRKKERGTVEANSLEGVPLISTVAYAPRSGWLASIGLPQASLSAPSRAQLMSLLVVGLPITLLTLMTGLLLARYLNRSMEALSGMAARVGRGDVVRFEPTRLTDANRLGQVLEATSVELQRRAQAFADLNATLESQVLTRTAQLSDTNARLQEEIARREASEAQLRQAQKMEAVGQLTGGIAHDFNNMLAVVISSLNLLRRRLDQGDTAVHGYIDGAMTGAERAANLVRRLLAFSRQHPLSPEPIDPNKLLAGMEEVLRRTIPETISIEMVLAGGLWRSFADVNGLENALLNLAVNARDAMPNGGKLTIETANAHLDDAYAASHAEVLAGQYVLIAVTDTGGGMSEAVIGRAFDPFFTTKPTGSGTGLGLSQVYGFIKQSGGHVKIYSEIDVGTTVKLYLPRYAQKMAAETVSRRKADGQDRGAGQTVLVVEDDADVRKLTVEMLRELDYTAIAAENGPRALELLQANPAIALLLTDVVMPIMNGRELADEATRRAPALKVLFTTGYTRNAIVHNGVLDEGVHLIIKPFTLEGLAAKLKAVFAA